jgi:hypothetical protein
VQGCLIWQVLGAEPQFTSCHGRIIDTLDYIWFTPLAAPAQPDQARQPELPNGAAHADSSSSLGDFEHILGPVSPPGSHAAAAVAGPAPVEEGNAEAWELLPMRVVHVPPLSVLRCGLPAPEYPSDHISLIADFSSRRLRAAPQHPVHPPRPGYGHFGLPHSQHIRFGED